MDYYDIEPSGYEHHIPTQPDDKVESRVLDSGSLQVFRRGPREEEVLGTYTPGSRLVRG